MLDLPKVDETPNPVEAQAEAPTQAQVQLTAEELQKQITEGQTRIKSLEQTISKQGLENRKLRETSELIIGLHSKQDRLEETLATVLDYLEEIRGVPEETQTQVGRHKAELEQKRKEQITQKPIPVVDSDVKEFGKYCAKHGIDEDHPLWKEVVVGSSSPLEAIEALKPKVKAIEEAEQKKRDKAEEDKLNTRLQAELKRLGLTTGEAGGPTAATVDLNKLSPREQLAWGIAHKKK